MKPLSKPVISSVAYRNSSVSWASSVSTAVSIAESKEPEFKSTLARNCSVCSQRSVTIPFHVTPRQKVSLKYRRPLKALRVWSSMCAE